MPKNMIYDDVSEKAGAPKKMKTNQDGGGESSTAAAGEIKSNQKMEGTPKGMDHKKGGARKGAAKGMDHKKGGAKYVEGAADFKGGLHAKNTKHSESGEHLGAKRMGYSQSFGAARVSGYSKGAAKVADIMSFGASKYMKAGAADEGKPKKNTSGIFGGDGIIADENKDGNMVTRGLKKLDKFLSDPTQKSTRPITKDGKLNFDAKLMDGVGTGLPKK